ncbi:hypothetical protein [Kibdelosporangium phytohabitans]|uniref:Prenyltransferase n=1 Tax=Kibdelosporangium phytohabitans TaxID=860235 RepID=A0A0N9I871_9PSEU|nr:hypothetical protein [Kibdelosporangium phytohabitans]ALG12403.1 hypothetical protein AOZ06_41045 [Kibdelosporangium phytohabitans]MBE1463984.1 hypothetical protein [Kibdelosporangium phytohabitans]
MTGAWIASVQEPSGAIPWFPGGPSDVWNHVEAAMGLDVSGFHAEAAAAYRWLARVRNSDGSWYAEYRAGEVTDPAKDSNFVAYIAVGVLHHALACRDTEFLTELWPTVRAAIDFVLGLRSSDGAVRWRDSSPIFLITGCSSIHQALLCAAAIAARVGSPRPDWLTAARELGSAIRDRPDVFEAKPHSMDWYYPVLCGVVTGSAADERLSAQWDRFVVPGLGVRCVSDQPWVTGGETAELALTLALRGDSRAAQLLADISHLRHADGSHWTGYQFANQVVWPEERTTWTAGAVLLATAALRDDPSTHGAFKPLSLVLQRKPRYPIE